MVSRPSVVTVSSFGRQKLIENMTRISVYEFKQVIVSSATAGVSGKNDKAYIT